MSNEELCDLIAARCTGLAKTARLCREEAGRPGCRIRFEYLLRCALDDWAAAWTPEEWGALEGALGVAGERLTGRLVVHLTPTARLQVEMDAAQAGLTVSAYVRERLGV